MMRAVLAVKVLLSIDNPHEAEMSELSRKEGCIVGVRNGDKVASRL